MNKIIIKLLFVTSGLKAAALTPLKIKSPEGEKLLQVPILWQKEKDDVERDTMPSLRALVQKDPRNVNATYIWPHNVKPAGCLNVLMFVAGDLAHVEGTKYLLENGAYPTACVMGRPRTHEDSGVLGYLNFIGENVSLDNAASLVAGKACNIRWFIDRESGKTHRECRSDKVTERDLKKAHDLASDWFPFTHAEADIALNKITESGYIPNKEQSLQQFLPQLPSGVTKIVSDYHTNDEWYAKRYDYIERGKRYIEIFKMMKAKQRELEGCPAPHKDKQ